MNMHPMPLSLGISLSKRPLPLDDECVTHHKHIHSYLDYFEVVFAVGLETGMSFHGRGVELIVTLVSTSKDILFLHQI